MINISIFGSCVSRDIFKEEEKNFNIKTYVTRQNFASLNAKPLECNKDDINLDSKFKVNSIFNDFSKITLDQFCNDADDFILIELINEQFPILKYKDSYITLSEFLESSEYINNLEELRKNNIVYYESKNDGYFLEGVNISTFLDNFAEKILSRYSPNKIILNKGCMAYKYIDKDNKIKTFSSGHIDWSKNINKRLFYMYDYLENKFKDCKTIDICDKYYASELNKWGLSSSHYEIGYYEECYEILLDYCNSFQEQQNINFINDSILEELRNQNKELLENNKFLVKQNDDLISENNKIKGQLKWARKELDIVRSERLELKKQLSNIQSSRSYKLLNKLNILKK